MWNFLSDSEIPTVSLLVEGNAALNKLRLNQSRNQIAVGDDNGRISLYDVNEAFANPVTDGWTNFVQVLKALKQNSVNNIEVSSPPQNEPNNTIDRQSRS